MKIRFIALSMSVISFLTLGSILGSKISQNDFKIQKNNSLSPPVSIDDITFNSATEVSIKFIYSQNIIEDTISITKTDTGGNVQTEYVRADTTGNSTNIVFSNLESETQYTLRLTQDVPGEPDLSTTTQTIFTPSLTPEITNINISEETSTTVKLKFNLSDHSTLNFGGSIRYTVDGTNWINVTQFFSSNSILISNLNVNQTYSSGRIELKPGNYSFDKTTKYYNIPTFTTTLKEAPSINLSITSDGITSNSVDVDVSLGNYQNISTLEYSLTGNSDWKTINFSSNNFIHKITGLSSDTFYNTITYKISEKPLTTPPVNNIETLSPFRTNPISKVSISSISAGKTLALVNLNVDHALFVKNDIKARVLLDGNLVVEKVISSSNIQEGINRLDFYGLKFNTTYQIDILVSDTISTSRTFNTSLLNNGDIVLEPDNFFFDSIQSSGLRRYEVQFTSSIENLTKFEISTNGGSTWIELPLPLRMEEDNNSKAISGNEIFIHVPFDVNVGDLFRSNGDNDLTTRISEIKNRNSSSGISLNVGEISGIVIGSIAFVIFLILSILWFIRNRNGSQQKEKKSKDGNIKNRFESSKKIKANKFGNFFSMFKFGKNSVKEGNSWKSNSKDSGERKMPKWFGKERGSFGTNNPFSQQQLVSKTFNQSGNPFATDGFDLSQNSFGGDSSSSFEESADDDSTKEILTILSEITSDEEKRNNLISNLKLLAENPSTQGTVKNVGQSTSYKKWTVPELRKIAKRLNIENYSKMRKAQLEIEIYNRIKKQKRGFLKRKKR